MPDNSARLPAEHRAGDTLSQRVSLADFPASAGWALAYTLVGPTSVYAINATADGDDFLIEESATTTAAWAPGGYQAQATVTLAAKRQTVDISRIFIAADLAAMTTGADTRTHARKVLDSINTWLETRAPTVGALSLDGRKLENYPLGDLLALRDRYRAEVYREERAAAGKGQGRILMRL